MFGYAEIFLVIFFIQQIQSLKKNYARIYMLIILMCHEIFFYLGAATCFYCFTVNSYSAAIVEFDTLSLTPVTSKYF